MSVTDVAAPTLARDSEHQPIPTAVKTRLDRGRRAMLKDASKRRLCMRFERGDTYWYVNEKGLLTSQSTVTFANGGGKPRYRIRNTYNFIRPIVQGKVSAATQRIPSYECLPSTTDPEDQYAARLAQKVALYGYDKWRLRRVSVKCATLAIGGGGDAFAMPYFDPNVGPYVQMPDNTLQGEGEIKILVLNGNEVYWEPGVDFYESRWHAIERAMPIEDVREMPGFDGGALAPDASISDVPTDKGPSDNLVMVTQFFERPCPKYPAGRRLVIANNRVVINYRLIAPQGDGSPFEPYPLRDPKGQVIDEPILHRLQWNVDTDTDRDFGLTWQLIDAQRTIQDCWNKLLEWKNRCLNPRRRAAVGSIVGRPDDEPGGIDYYHAGMGPPPEWERVPTEFAGPLFQMLTRMQADMREMGFDTQLAAEANVAARTVSAVIEQYQAKWQSFIGDYADWHSRLMRHCLLLVQNHYTEKRKLTIRGRFGPENIPDFDGSQLLGQVDVRVLPGSLEYLTRDQVVQRVFAYADRQWITPQQAMIAINMGTADALIQSLELDLARIARIIQKIRDGSVMDMPNRTEMRPDPMTGELVPQEIPSYMPLDQVDDLDVWHSTLADWMKTEDYEKVPSGLQEVAKQIMSGIEATKVAAQQRMVAQQEANAAQLGLDNAAKPQQAKPLPDQAGPTPPADRSSGPPVP